MSFYTDVRDIADVEINDKRMAVATFQLLGEVDQAGNSSVVKSVEQVPIIGDNFTILERDTSVVQSQDFKIMAPAKRFDDEPDGSWQVVLGEQVYEIRNIKKIPAIGVTAVYEFQVGR